ncbi:MAG: dihydroneopterin aldolase [Actinomycetota bacterium]|nr:dihydroneopterin aldolase [Actinomycetota bacterium]
MDSIIVRDLRVRSRIGVTEEERAEPQTVIIGIEIASDLRRPGMSDDLADTVDYGQVTQEIEALVSSTTSALLENLAEKIAGHIAAMPGVNGVSVEVAKESPPIQQSVGSVAVRIERL